MSSSDNSSSLAQPLPKCKFLHACGFRIVPRSCLANALGQCGASFGVLRWPCCAESSTVLDVAVEILYERRRLFLGDLGHRVCRRFLLAGLRLDEADESGDERDDENRDDHEFEVVLHHRNAAEEIARQLRLRDMGGIIVIDFIDMDEAENRQKLYDRMRELMANDRARHNILPLSKFGLMQITRQRVRPALDIITSEDCPTCHGKGTIPPSLLFTDLLESKIHYLVYKLKIKKFTLHVHPFVAAYVNQGVFSLKMKWRCKYTFQLKVIPNQSLAYLEYKFYDAERNEIDLKEEIEIKK